MTESTVFIEDPPLMYMGLACREQIYCIAVDFNRISEVGGCFDIFEISLACPSQDLNPVEKGGCLNRTVRNPHV